MAPGRSLNDTSTETFLDTSPFGVSDSARRFEVQQRGLSGRARVSKWGIRHGAVVPVGQRPRYQIRDRPTVRSQFGPPPGGALGRHVIVAWSEPRSASRVIGSPLSAAALGLAEPASN